MTGASCNIQHDIVADGFCEFNQGVKVRAGAMLRNRVHVSCPAELALDLSLPDGAELLAIHL